MRKSILFFLLFIFPVFAFAGVVKGVVRDTSGQPLPFVVVGVKNSTYGVNTNLTGAYFMELKAGNYTLVFSQLGFVSQEKNIVISDDHASEVNVVMNSDVRVLNEAQITAKGDRDKGKEIMKEVIAHRDDYWNRVQNYKCDTYQKSSLEKILREKPDSAIVPIAPPKVDTTKKGKKKNKGEDLQAEINDDHLNLIESVSTTFFKAPNQFKENIIAYHDYAGKKKYEGGNGGASVGVEYGEHEIAPVTYEADNPYLLVSDAQSADFNFYKNEIDAPSLCSRPLKSPAATGAFLSYRFEYVSSFEENGKTIHRINVIPLFNEDALFYGTIFIEDSTWAIVSVNLNINSGALLYCKDFSVIEDYSEVDSSVYLPVRREFNYTIREGKYNIIGNTRVDHTNYVVNGTIPPKTFNDEVKHYADDAFDKDSTYWSENRPLHLEDKEISYVHKVDSLTEYYTSPAYYAHIDSSFNHINVWSFLLNGVGHRNRATGTEFFFDPLIADVVPFGVGGYRQKLGGYFNKDFDNGYKLETEEQIDYGFLNKDVRGKVGVGLTYMPLHFVRTFVRVGDYYDMVNNYASLESVFARSNYVRCREISVAQRAELVNGLYAELTLEYSDKFPITGMKLESWSQYLFDTLNTPSDFQEYIKSEVRLELKYRFKQKYIIKNHKKIIIGTKYPEIRFFYRKGIPGLFNSEIDFDYIEIGSQDELKLGRFGTSDWNILYGSFLNKKDLRLLEYKYFRGSDSFIFSDPMRSFQLLGPRLSTSNSFFRLNYIHHFEGVFGTKIPFFNKLKITAAVGGGVLMIPDQKFTHEEFFLGLERIVRIKKQLFRIGVFAVTADSNVTKAAITYKVGISYYNTFTRKWSY
ncbi:MAG: carboxypeptidase-like regulatory domain-containing protein [Bacteroidetes bacterium]|nr:carboxypeptidase-like regulatory domain-containing protein [Bacteroidota bacterium]